MSGRYFTSLDASAQDAVYDVLRCTLNDIVHLPYRRGIERHFCFFSTYSTFQRIFRAPYLVYIGGILTLLT